MPDFDLLQKQQQNLWQAKGLDAPAKGPGAGPAPLPSMSPQGAGPAPAAASPEEMARMLDRQKAQKELADRFQIVDEMPEGKERLPNQVTQADYEKLCNTYSDIRTGNSHIKLDAGKKEGEEAEAFKALVMNDIGSMLQTEVGRALLSELSTQKDAGGEDLTTTIGEATRGPTWARAFPTARTEASLRYSENSIGTNMSAEYAPGQDVTKPNATQPWFPMRSDVVLFHELTHALHGTRGQMEKGNISPQEAGPGDDPLPGSDEVPLEEYATVGLGRFQGSTDQRYAVNENAYRAERRAMAGQAGMRAGDDDFAMEKRTSYMTSTAADEEKENRMRLAQRRP